MVLLRNWLLITCHLEVLQWGSLLRIGISRSPLQVQIFHSPTDKQNVPYRLLKDCCRKLKNHVQIQILLFFSIEVLLWQELHSVQLSSVWIVNWQQQVVVFTAGRWCTSKTLWLPTTTEEMVLQVIERSWATSAWRFCSNSSQSSMAERCGLFETPHTSILNCLDWMWNTVTSEQAWSYSYSRSAANIESILWQWWLCCYYSVITVSSTVVTLKSKIIS